MIGPVLHPGGPNKERDQIACRQFRMHITEHARIIWHAKKSLDITRFCCSRTDKVNVSQLLRPFFTLKTGHL